MLQTIKMSKTKAKGETIERDISPFGAILVK